MPQSPSRSFPVWTGRICSPEAFCWFCPYDWDRQTSPLEWARSLQYEWWCERTVLTAETNKIWFTDMSVCACSCQRRRSVFRLCIQKQPRWSACCKQYIPYNQLSSLLPWSTLAPFVTSIRAVSVLPQLHAYVRGVRPGINDRSREVNMQNEKG